MTTLTIIRGLPGSGKSTFAQSLGGTLHLEADMFHVKDGEYQWDGKRIKDAHRWCLDVTERALCQFVDVVVSNTFTQKWELSKYLSMVNDLNNKGVDVKVQIFKCTGNYGNIHKVPHVAISKMSERWEDIEGEIEV